MMKFLGFTFILILSSCVKQELVEDITSLTQKFQVNSISDKNVFEGDYLQIFNASVGVESELDVTYTCHYDQIVDGQVLSSLACSTLSGLSFNSTNAYLYWNIDYSIGDLNPSYEFKITATDAEASDDEIFIVNIQNLNRSPDLGLLSNISIDEGLLFVHDFDDLSGADTDVDGDANQYYCYYTNDNNALALCSSIGIFLDTNTGVFTWSPSIHTSYLDKEFSLQIIVSDGVDSKSHPLKVTVKHINQSPSISHLSQITSNFSANEIEVYQGASIEPLDFYNSFVINSGFDFTNPLTTYQCFYDTIIDQKVIGSNSCSSIGVSFDLEKKKFVFDENLNIAPGNFEVKLTINDVSTSSETLYFNVNHPQELEDIDEDSDEITYRCYYDEVIDASVLSALDCSNINIVFDTYTGKLSWNAPHESSNKTYEIKIQASDSSLTSSDIFVLKSVKVSRVNLRDIKIATDHQCALSHGSDLYCWGKNTNGQLGVGDTYQRKVPINLSSLHSIEIGFKKVEVSQFHTCALNDKAQLYCWGDSSYGQSGVVGSSAVIAPSLIDTSLMNNEHIIDFATSGSTTCVVNAISSIFCFGKANNGELGNNSFLDTFRPTSRAFLPSGVNTKVISITAGDSFFCVLDDIGDVYCWGDNTSGNFANATVISSNTPTKSNLSGIIKLRASDKSLCAIDKDYKLLCSGDNAFGKLGVNSVNPNEPSAMVVNGFVSDFNLSDSAMCFVEGVTNSIYCSGSNANGELGNPLSPASSALPLIVDAHNNKKEIFMGANSACTISDQGANCWGSGASYLFSDFSVGSKNTPTLVDLNILNEDDIDLVNAGIGDGFGCSINSRGQVYCFGDNSQSNLGMGVLDRADRPLAIFSSGNSFFDLNVGRDSVCLKDQALIDPYCFGANTTGKLNFAGAGVDINQAQTFLSQASSSISSKGDHSCFIDENFELRCSGANDQSQLGIGTVSALEDISLVDTSLIATDKFAKVVTGESHTCALSNEGDIYCFGKGLSYQLGQGSTANETRPLAIDTSGISNKKFIDIFANHSNTCAINTMFELICWGDNSSGQQGAGSIAVLTKPKKVSTAHFSSSVYFKDVAIGVSSICAIDILGSLYCSGNNSFGQFGDSLTINSYQLKKVDNNLSSNHYYKNLTGHGNTNCAVNSDKKLYCWGENKLDMFGEFSNLSQSTIPVLIEHN